MRRIIGITTTGIVATILAGWKSGDRALGISTGVLAATAADALWPGARPGPSEQDLIDAARGSGGGPGSTPAL